MSGVQRGLVPALLGIQTQREVLERSCSAGGPWAVAWLPWEAPRQAQKRREVAGGQPVVGSWREPCWENTQAHSPPKAEDSRGWGWGLPWPMFLGQYREHSLSRCHG